MSLVHKTGFRNQVVEHDHLLFFIPGKPGPRVFLVFDHVPVVPVIRQVFKYRVAEHGLPVFESEHIYPLFRAFGIVIVQPQ